MNVLGRLKFIWIRLRVIISSRIIILAIFLLLIHTFSILRVIFAFSIRGDILNLIEIILLKLATFEEFLVDGVLIV